MLPSKIPLWDAPERHQTFKNAIKWSIDLLNPEEQILFHRLSVFQGGRSIEAVQEICCFDLTIDVLDGLESLLSKSLIQQEDGIDGEPHLIFWKQFMNIPGNSSVKKEKLARSLSATQFFLLNWQRKLSIIPGE